MLALFSVPAFGQGPGIRFGDQQPVQSGQTPGGPIYSVPNATINFCNSPANGSPCTNKAVTYTDITLTTACPSSQQVVLSTTNNCVATTDSYGNWGVWVQAGTYTFTIQVPGGASIGPYTVTLASGGGGASILPTNNTFTGTNNFLGGLFINNLSAVSLSGAITPGDCTKWLTASTVSDAGSACGSGGGGAPAGSNGDIQVKNGASFASGVTSTANVGVAGNIAVKPPSSASVIYAASYGSDSNDGLSLGSPKLYIDTAICSLPTGTCPGQAGQGTVIFANNTSANATPGTGIWLACNGDPNFASLPSGWMKGPPGSQGLNIEGIETVNSGPHPTIPKALIAATSASRFQRVHLLSISRM